ncbi:AMP-binding protein [Mucilaginibacter sp. RCC_168]|uniref:AMP-binding protein n=1 Tax=Mucilaginibacter sp. RCC_168 TaxID=3239221 RepID=UPI003526B33B
MEEIQDNIVKYLKKNATIFPEKTAFIFADTNDASDIKISYGELHNRIESLANQLLFRSHNGKNVLLVYDNTLEFIISFFACQYVGAVAVPIAPLLKNNLTEKFLNVIKDSEASLILCSNSLLSKIEYSLKLNHLEYLPIFATDLNYPLIESSRFPDILNSGISFIQYTSGSTDNPKGVVITHENLISNQRQIKQAFNCNKESIIFSWLPFHHDMGLVGNIIQSIYVGCTCILVSPFYFFQQPKIWIEAISKFKVTHSGGPNFAYDLCIKAMADSDLSKIDLSSWKVAFNGADYIKPGTITQFSFFFRPCGFKKNVFYPCYGLAEATLLVSGIKSSKKPTIISINKGENLEDGGFIQLTKKNNKTSEKIVSSGKVPDALTVKIILTKYIIECQELQCGEICISGKNVTKRYWSGLSGEGFIELGGNRYLKTGDIGFFYNNELFVIGRIKEMLIVRGKNYYPYDIERAVSESHSKLESNGVVVFENPQEKDTFIIAAELQRKFLNQIDLTQIINSISRCVTSKFGISPSDIVILKPRAIPRTTSGKLQRLLCKELYLKKDFKSLMSKNKIAINVTLPQTKTELLNRVILEKDFQSVKKYLIYIIALKSGLTDIELLEYSNLELNEIGVDSLIMVEIINIINKDFSINLQASDIFKNSRLSSLINFIEQIVWLKYNEAHGNQIIL